MCALTQDFSCCRREESEQQRVQKLEELQAVRGRVSALQKDYFKRHESFLVGPHSVGAVLLPSIFLCSGLY